MQNILRTKQTPDYGWHPASVYKLYIRDGTISSNVVQQNGQRRQKSTTVDFGEKGINTQHKANKKHTTIEDRTEHYTTREKKTKPKSTALVETSRTAVPAGPRNPRTLTSQCTMRTHLDVTQMPMRCR